MKWIFRAIIYALIIMLACDSSMIMKMIYLIGSALAFEEYDKIVKEE